MSKKIILIIILILLAGNVFFGYKYFVARGELYEVQAVLKTQQINERVLEFTKLFIKEVLEAETEVNFETRLKLENAVRNLENSQIMAQWQKFVESQTENEAQQEVKNLLEALVNKIKVN